MHVTRSAYIGIAGVAAGLMMLAFAFASGITPAQGQTPGTTVTAVAGSPTTAATTPAGTSTSAVGTTTPAGTPTRGALTPSGTTAAATPTAALPSTGTGPGAEDGTALWVAGAGILLAIVGSTFALTGVHRRR